MYNKLIVIFILLQWFGNIGGAYQPARIFVIFFIPFILTHLISKRFLSLYKNILSFFLFWLIWGGLSFFWILDINEYVNEISYLFINMLSRLLFIFTLPLAFIEILFDFHLNISSQADKVIDSYGTIKKFASITFLNYNGYVRLLSYIVPFLLSSFLINRNRFSDFILFLFLVVIVFINGSRGGLFVLLISFILLIHYKYRQLYFKLIILFFLLSLFLIMNYVYPYTFESIISRSQDIDVGELQTRPFLIYNSLRLFFETHCMGVGAGNFKPSMDFTYDIDTVPAHNFFLEILVQYGILVFVFFLIFLFGIYENKSLADVRYKYILLASLLSYPFVNVIDSIYIRAISPWIHLSSLYIIAKFNLKK